jgi:uncharacterized protein
VQGNDRPGSDAAEADGAGFGNQGTASGQTVPAADTNPADRGTADGSADAAPEMPHEANPVPSGPGDGTHSLGTTPPPGAYAYAPSGTPYPPGPGTASYPPASYPPGSYPAGAGAPPYGAGPTGAGPYPPGPYPSAAPVAGSWPAGNPAAHVPAPPSRRRPSWAAPSPTRTHRWGLGAYLLAEAVFLLASVLIRIFLIGDDQPTVGVLIIGLAAPTVLAAGTALLITRLRGNGPRIDLRLEWSWREVGLGLAFGFGGLALTIPASIMYVAIVGQDASSAVGDALGGIRAGPVLAILVLLIVVFIAPMCEEILYRGLLWGGVERLAGRWVAFAVTTAMFALAHFEITRTPLLLIVAIPIAVARLYTGRLLPAIVAHQVNNLLPGIVLMLGLLGVVPVV